MIELAIGIAIGIALGVFRAQVWAGVKKLFGKAETAVAAKLSKPAAPAPKAPAKP